jgi:hypothetical protein
MPLGLGKCSCALDEGEGLAEIPKTVGPLDPLRSIQQLPVRCLYAVAGGLFLRRWRHAAATGGATLFDEC